jgi:small subunit ribosomal protein S17
MSGETIESNRGSRKERTGKVVSSSGSKSIVVPIERRVRHPLYGKIQRKVTRCHAHDEANEAHVGDVVRISETRPLSRLKRWRLIQIVSQGGEVKGSTGETAI